MERFTFDDAYVRRLLEGDRETQEHFEAYFRELIRQTLGGRVSPDVIPDLQQEVFRRVWEALPQLQDGRKLGGFVYSFCKNVLREHYRDKKRYDRTDGIPVPPEPIPIDEELSNEETCIAVRHTLDLMPKRDAEILRDVFLREIPLDEVCSKHGIDRDYLRVLIHRAKEKFRKLYKG